MEFTYIIEKTNTGYSAYAPALPGCIAAAATLEVTETLIREGIVIYLEELDKFGYPMPEPLFITAEMERERYYTGALAVDRAVPA